MPKLHLETNLIILITRRFALESSPCVPNTQCENANNWYFLLFANRNRIMTPITLQVNKQPFTLRDARSRPEFRRVFLVIWPTLVPATDEKVFLKKHHHWPQQGFRLTSGNKWYDLCYNLRGYNEGLIMRQKFGR